LNRYTPADPASEWLSLDSLKLNGHLRYSFGATSDYARKPLVLFGPTRQELDAPVSDQLYLHLGGAVVLFDQLRLSANLPVLIVNKGEPGLRRGQTYATDEGFSLGDLRLGGDYRMLGGAGEAFSLAAGMQLYIPTGNRDAYASDGTLRVVPRIQAAGEMGIWVYAARLAFDARFLQADFGGLPFGNEVAFAAAAGVRIADRRLMIGPEFFGSTVVSDGVIFKKRATPMEAVLSARYRITDEMGVGVSGGPGFTPTPGSPAFRVLVSFFYSPAVEIEPSIPPPEQVHDVDGDGVPDGQDACPNVSGPERPAAETNGCPDSDGDTILDSQDACPQLAGEPSDDPKKHGCNVPKDKDGDGILDAFDACPTEAGVASSEPEKHGCPILPDADDDGVPDRDDACRDVFGSANPDPKLNGCRPDTDHDFIFDSHDACPATPGEPDPLPTKNGCPKVEVAGSELKLLERIEFEDNGATVRISSMNVLSGVLRVLNEHPEFIKVRIEVYTDDVGNAAANKQLAKDRANAVIAWLGSLGLPASRFEAVGHGKDKPLVPGTTEEARQANRRVRITVVGTSGTAP